jgi:hypothetical protein
MLQAILKHKWVTPGLRLLPIVGVTVLPLLFAGELRQVVWNGVRPRAWDGSGHFAVAQLYSQSIFPDTFGWTPAFFDGMPVPNFYPPLFYWSVALLHHSHLVSFLTAFKLAVVVPVLMLPAAIWILGWRVSDKNRTVATCAACAILPLLVDYRFSNNTGLLGLSYSGTFIYGLYSQTLGFVLLIAWYVSYSSKRQQAWRFALSTVLLALAVLANFFSGATAAIFIATTAYQDFTTLRTASDMSSRQQARRALLAHLVSPLIAFCLTLFWLGPMLNAYDYFVTRPQAVPFSALVTPAVVVWYLLALIGVFIWLERPTNLMGPYLVACLILEVAVFLAATAAPRWLPLYPPRFAMTLNFLLAVPVGYTLSFGFQLVRTDLVAIADRRKMIKTGMGSQHPGFIVSAIRTLRIALLLLVVPFVVWWITPLSYRVAFYQTSNNSPIDPVLAFALSHKDGRYLVEVPSFNDAEASFDGRALNSYLGLQGNEALTVFFREASPSVIFIDPLVNAFSVQSGAYGVSSVLVDDSDFAQQPIANHLDQARFIGVRYLVVNSNHAKIRLDQANDIVARHDFGQWSIFELHNELPKVRKLAFKPALLVSHLSLKARRRTEYGFIRFAEEQFADSWFDVLLAFSAENKIDRLQVPDGFGALVIDTYDCDDESRAYEMLRKFAQTRPLILLANDTPLFHRISNTISDFPKAEIIMRELEPPGEWLESNEPTTNYRESDGRKVWKEIRQKLDSHKAAVENSTPLNMNVAIKTGQTEMTIEPGAVPTDEVPVLIGTTYHPNWVREDKGPIYAATPFFMLTFVRHQTRLTFRRRPFDWLSLIISASALLGLGGFMIWSYRQRLRSRWHERNFIVGDARKSDDGQVHDV